MRITLCVNALAPQPAGIGRYTWELCKGLACRSDIRSLHYFGHERLIDEPQLLIDGAELPRRRRLLQPLYAWKARQVLRSSLVHGPNYFLPASAEGGVITIHDLSVFRFPETHPERRIRDFERQFANSLSRSAHIITDSETIRRELIASFSVRPDSVTAVPLGVDERFAPSHGSQSKALQHWGLTANGYGLCVSTLEPRKKILELMSAWEMLPRKLRSQVPLVLAGGSGWENERLYQAIERGVTQGWVRHLGFVDEEVLPDLYAGAALFIYPSIYEGFGLPPLEAMAAGVPVIAAGSSCLPEVCGDAPRYVDPDDVEAFASTIQACLSSSEWRTAAVEKGLRHVRQFRWDRCIEDTVAVYRIAAGAK